MFLIYNSEKYIYLDKVNQHDQCNMTQAKMRAKMYNLRRLQTYYIKTKNTGKTNMKNDIYKT